MFIGVKMKQKVTYIFLLLLTTGLISFYIEPITTKISGLLRPDPAVVINKPNAHYRDVNFNFITQSKDFIPYSKQDLKNIFYSILNNGYELFTFYCPSEYLDCIKDLNEISENQETLTHINNFVHPFNSFEHIKATYRESTGEVTIQVEHLYTNKEIAELSNKVDEILGKVIKGDMDDEAKILAIHDYIINNTKYDTQKLKDESPYHSNTAYGSLLEGYALCSGYADAMAIFLNRLNVPNFKVSSSTHIWNVIYFNNTWLHLDLTWDDPVDESEPAKNHLIYKFYLISTETLEDYKITEHGFDKTIYRELVSE